MFLINRNFALMKRILFVFVLLFLVNCTQHKSNKKTPVLLYLLANSNPVINDDFLTPKYYDVSSTDPFKTEVDSYLTEVRKVTLQKPITVSYTIPSEGTFSADKGAEYHHALDLHPVNSETNVNIYASHAGTVTMCQTQGPPSGNVYRHFISVATDITNSSGTIVGKMVTIYAHLSLDLDSGMPSSGSQVTKGQLISQHLYSQTKGGPHLHFEVRYYRPTDNVTNNCTLNGTTTGLPEYYGWPASSSLTTKSSGPWSLGYWDPSVGYGFGYPPHQGLFL